MSYILQYSFSHSNCFIFSTPSNRVAYSATNLAICQSCYCLTFYGILSLFLSFILAYTFALNFPTSSSFLFKRANYFLASICVPSYKNILLFPIIATPHPFGISFSSFTILIFVHLPKVASKSTCFDIIYYWLIM